MPLDKQFAICQMFDRIANTYDSANRILSLRQDLRWRQWVASDIPDRPDLTMLDVATGTADLLIAMCAQRPDFKQAVGVDLSEKMLAVGQQKIDKIAHSDRMRLKLADASALPFSSASFDVVTIAFGIRNVVQQEQALREMSRVLKADGRLLVLEFSLPKNPLVRWAYLFYFRHILPALGGMISKEPSAYRYLNRTVEDFSSERAFKKTMLENGFLHVDTKPLTFGIATVYTARKCL